MKLIKIEALSDGAHQNQTCYNFGIAVPDGWAVVPDTLTIPDTFPFVDVVAEEVDGVMTVTAMTAGTVPEMESEPEPTPEPSVEARVDDLETLVAGMLFGGDV